MTMKRIGIGQEWVSAGKRARRQAVAQAQVDRETLAQHSAAAQARLQAALAYLDAYFAGEGQKLTTLAEHHFHEELEAAKGRFASSAGSSHEVLALTAARGLAEDESAEVRQAEANAKLVLQRWLGTVPITLSPPSLPPPPSEDAFVAGHPSVLAAQREAELARREAGATAADRKPNWSWQVSYGQRSGYSDMMSFGVNIPLAVSPSERQDRDTASKLALVEKADAALAEASRAAAAEYHGLASDAQRLAQRIERYQAAVVLPAQQRTQSALAGYRSNQAGLGTVFEARHMEVDVQRKLLTLKRDLSKAQAQLTFTPVQEGAAR